MKKRPDIQRQKKIALERIQILFDKAEQVFPQKPERATRYIAIARRIAMKLNIRLKKEQKRRFCKHCYHYLLPGNNAITRIHKSRIITLCKNCKKFTRIPLKKK